jgi:hypothetical protein
VDAARAPGTNNRPGAVSIEKCEDHIAVVCGGDRDAGKLAASGARLRRLLVDERGRLVARRSQPLVPWPIIGDSIEQSIGLGDLVADRHAAPNVVRYLALEGVGIVSAFLAELGAAAIFKIAIPTSRR